MGASKMRDISEAWCRREVAFLLACTLVIGASCFGASLDWIGQPFNGFLMARNRIVMPIAQRYWSGPRAGIPYRWRLTAIDDAPVTSVREALAAARRAGAGASLLYTFTRGQQTRTLRIPVIVFTTQDYLAIFANYLFNGLAFLLMGFLVAFLRPRLEAAQAMLALSLSYGLSLVLSLADFATYQFRPLAALAQAAAPATLLYLAASFPTEQPWLHRGKLKPLLIGSTVTLAALDIGLYDHAPEAWIRYFDASLLWLATALVLTIALLWNQYRTAPSAMTREKLKVVFLGTVVAFAFPAALITGGYLIGAQLPLHVFPAATWIFPAALAYAIVKRDLFEIDVFLRRVTAYVALSAAVFLIYGAIVAVLSRLFHGLSFAASPWFTLFFSLLVAVLVRPGWAWVQDWVDRVFFRTRFDYAEIIQSVSEALTRTRDAQDIAVQVRTAVQRTMAPTACRLYIYDPSTERFTAPDGEVSALTPAEDARRALGAGEILDRATFTLLAGQPLPHELTMLVPVCFETRLGGVLALGPKKSGATYGPRDRELLSTLANQTAVALRNAASYGRVTELLSSLENRVEERTHELQDAQRELQSTNQKLRELDRLKTRFFADASHELRTPLTLVLGPLEELRRRGDDLGATARQMIDLAHTNASRLLVLTDTLLDLSRLDAGGLQARLRGEHLGRLVEHTAEPFTWLAQQRGIDLQLNGLNQPVTALCDSAMVWKIVGNLLANALKFTTEGRIEVSVLRKGTQAGIRVADTGPGIAASDLPHIFDRYQQAAIAERGPLSGSGLGLALVRELAELQEGTVDVSSREGAGTTFTVWLPGAPDMEAAGGGYETASPPPPRVSLGALAAANTTVGSHVTHTAAGDAPSVLVVDDNPNMLAFVRELLTENYHVRCAPSSVDAFSMLRVRKPDIILSDVMMPGPDGVALCRAIKRDRDLRHIPLILLTARASLESKVSGLAAGADDYITKPFHPEELRARIAALLRMRKTERELSRSHQQLERAYDELRDAQAQLVQAEKMASLGILVAGVAHEINNPVSFISSSIDLINTSIAELREDLKTVHLSGRALALDERFTTLEQNAAICLDGARRASRIVGDLRTFSRPATGLRKPTDLHDLLDRSLRLISGEKRGRITVHRDYDQLPPVSCDAGQIGQVFLNLLVNAVQAIDGRGDVSLRTRHTGDRVRIEIEDTGNGMDEAVQEHIFDPFFTTKDVGQGTGLGLSIVRSLIEAHGGSITVRSIQGRGSVFTLTLPIQGVTT